MNEQRPILQDEDSTEDARSQVSNISNAKLLAGIAIIVLGALVAVGVGAYFYTYQTSPKEVACTQEAKICPDRTTVGRTGPNCEFSQCPGEEGAGIDTSNWKTYRSEEFGFEFRYPGDLIVDFNTKTMSLKVYDASYDSTGKVGAEVRGEYREVEFRVKPFSQELFDEEQTILDEELKSTKEHLRQSVSKNILRVPGGEGFIYMLWSDLIDNYRQTIFHNRQYIFITSPTYNEFIIDLLSTFKFIEPLDTSDWKTYRNGEYGFEVKHPLHLTTNERIRGGEELTFLIVELSAQGDDSGNIEVRAYTYTGNEELLQNYPKCFLREKIATDLISFQKNQWTSCEEGWMIWHEDNLFFIFPGAEGIALEQGNLLRKILSTFKFIEPQDVDVLDFENARIKEITYRNGRYHIILHAVKFYRCDASDPDCFVGYNIIDLEKEKEFPVSSTATITVITDALNKLVWDIILPEEAPYKPFRTVNFTDLMRRFAASGRQGEEVTTLLDGLLYSPGPYEVSFEGGEIVGLSQIYVP